MPPILRTTADEWNVLEIRGERDVPGYDPKIIGAGMSRAKYRVEVEGDWAATLGRVVYPEFGPIHKAIDPLPFDPYRPLMCCWDIGGCFSEDTEVLTEQGWKFFTEVTLQDRFATLNPKTREIEYQKPSRIVVRPHYGDMIEYRSKAINFCVTPEHRIWYSLDHNPSRLKVSTAEHVMDHCRHKLIPRCGEWKPEPPDKVLGFDPEVFAELMGIYLAEGSVFGSRVTIYQKDANPEIQRMLDATGLKWCRQETGKGAGWSVTSASLAMYLSTFGTSKEKFVPQEIHGFPPDLIRKFIDAYTIGDGYRRSRSGGRHGANGCEEHLCVTTSTRMAGDLQALALKAGWSASVRWVPPVTTTINEGGKFRDITNTGIWRVQFKKQSTHSCLVKANFSRVHYEGNVYCATVPNGTLYVRREGWASWSGNTPISGTPSCVVTQLNALRQWLIFSCIIPDEDGEAVGIWDFAGWVKHHLLTEFAEPNGLTLDELKVVHVGDPQGHIRPPKTYGMMSKGMEIKSCYEIIEKGYKQQVGEDDRGQPIYHEKPGYGWRIKGAERSLATRMEMLRSLLTMLVEGRPALVVDPGCKIIIDGFEGGYHYHQRSDGRYELDPAKNHYSHPLNCVEYGASYLSRAYEKGDRDERLPTRRNQRVAGRVGGG